MGIVLKQSFRNTITIYIAFAIGSEFLYTAFLEDTYYGLVTYLLSTANILMPLTAFGVQYTILKFFLIYFSKGERHFFVGTLVALVGRSSFRFFRYYVLRYYRRIPVIRKPIVAPHMFDLFGGHCYTYLKFLRMGKSTQSVFGNMNCFKSECFYWCWFISA